MSTIPRIAEMSPELRRELAKEIIGYTKDQSYQDFPLGQDAAEYLRVKRKRLTDSSLRDYEACLDKLARYFPTLQLSDLEPPAGTRLLETFLDVQWGDGSARTYNKNLSIIRDFLKFHRLRENMERDPSEPIERARPPQVHRTTFPADQRHAIIASQDELRDRIALRLLLDYGLRKGALKAIRFKHFDHIRKRLTIFTKGQKIRELPLPDPAFWHDLERHILDVEAKPSDFLMCHHKVIPRAGLRYFPDRPLSDSGLHRWWYRCLVRGGIVPVGTTKGEKMHKARHTAGQRILDATGNLKAAQKLLGHASIQTTGDVYADWDMEQLTATLADILGGDE